MLSWIRAIHSDNWQPMRKAALCCLFDFVHMDGHVICDLHRRCAIRTRITEVLVFFFKTARVFTQSCSLFILTAMALVWLDGPWFWDPHEDRLCRPKKNAGPVKGVSTASWPSWLLGRNRRLACVRSVTACGNQRFARPGLLAHGATSWATYQQHAVLAYCFRAIPSHSIHFSPCTDIRRNMYNTMYR